VRDGWGHEGGIPGYKSFALNDRGGTRSAIVLVPTEPDDAIAAAFQAAVTTAVCQTFDRDPPPASYSAAAPAKAPRPLPPSQRASSGLRLAG
jgi:hypothetical protein